MLIYKFFEGENLSQEDVILKKFLFKDVFVDIKTINTTDLHLMDKYKKFSKIEILKEEEIYNKTKKYSKYIKESFEQFLLKNYLDEAIVFDVFYSFFKKIDNEYYYEAVKNINIYDFSKEIPDNISIYNFKENALKFLDDKKLNKLQEMLFEEEGHLIYKDYCLLMLRLNDIKTIL